MIQLLCIYNQSDLSKKAETNAELRKQILYYYPLKTSLEDQLLEIGLAQTLQQFTSNRGTAPFIIWAGEKTKSILYRAEGEYFILLVLVFAYRRNLLSA